MRYSPCSFDSTVRVRFVCVFRAVTFAPATVAPLLSDTVPSMVAVVDCANTRCEKSIPNTATINHKFCLRFIASSEDVPLTAEGNMPIFLPYRIVRHHPTAETGPKNPGFRRVLHP